MKIHLDLDCYFVSAERTRYPFLKDKNVVVAKSSDKKIFSKDKKQGVILGDTGAFNSVLEFRNNYDANNILKAWRDEFLDENGEIHCSSRFIRTGCRRNSDSFKVEIF